ncbi:MAG: LPS-assembly protein LptD [Alphaproteobacteria bacterium]|nr:LPS-assembly protein LptD [Alphaproteobacteria bacterium]
MPRKGIQIHNTLFCLTFLIAVGAMPARAHANTHASTSASGATKPKKSSHMEAVAFDKNAPAYVIADQVQYDREQQMVYANGKVEVIQGPRILLAKRIVYDQKVNKVYAMGDVSLMEPNGDVYFSNELELEDEFKTGVIQQFKARFADNSLLVAKQATRQDAKNIKLEKAVYSPCPVCNTSLNQSPQWQFRAEKVKIDEEEQRVIYHDARFEVFGIPTFYTPYFSHALPNSPNKSGFLIPEVRLNSLLGSTVKVPYFWSIRPDMDAIIAPITTSKEGPVLTGEFRNLTDNGYYELQGSYTHPYKTDVNGVKLDDRESRGHLEGKGMFAMEDRWRWGFDFKRSSDDTYLKRYHLGNEDDLKSELYTDKLEDRDITSVKLLSFQGLNATDDPKQAANVLPLIDIHRESDTVSKGSRFYMDANTMSLMRLEGVRSNRISIKGGYNQPYISSGGQKIVLDTSIRGDGYYESDLTEPRAVRNPNLDGFAGRVVPEMEATWTYPLVRHNESSRVYIEPIAQMILSPYGGNSKKISNEDSLDYELSDLNLFSVQHYTGLDRVETGPRANVGIRSTIHSYGGSELGMLLGQNYRLREDHYLDPSGGLGDTHSDYVGQMSFSTKELMDISYRFRLNHDDLSFERNEIGLGLNLDPVKLDMQYLYLQRDFITGTTRDEVSDMLEVALNKYWNFIAESRLDLTGESGLISTSAGFMYKGPCSNMIIRLDKEYTRDRDVEPSTSIIFKISLKNLE